MQGEDETEDGSNTETENGNQIKAPGKRGYYSVAFTAVKLPDGMTNTSIWYRLIIHRKLMEIQTAVQMVTSIAAQTIRQIQAQVTIPLRSMWFIL